MPEQFVKRFLSVCSLILVLTNTQMARAATCADYDGAYIISPDGTYLGFIGNPFSQDSINNNFGTYGNEFNPLSVRSSSGLYGSLFSHLSVSNQFASQPPLIYRNQVPFAYLSTNSTKTPRVTLEQLDQCTFFASARDDQPLYQPQIPLPSAPFVLAVTGGVSQTGKGYIIAVWEQGAYALSYNVYVSTTSATDNFRFFGNVATTSVSITDLELNMQYWVAVTSVNEIGESEGYVVKNIVLTSDDSDGDGVTDNDDNCISSPNSEQTDFDEDGIGDACDDDDDDDGIADENDAFPFDVNESLDTDGDGVGNNSDTDDDGDGVADTQDVFPLDAAESLDTDGDGIGNNADTDDDGDGYSDQHELEMGSDQLSSSDMPRSGGLSPLLLRVISQDLAKEGEEGI
jgi:hypothetical protein